MASRGRSRTRRHEVYFHHTHRPLNCLAFLLPLLVVFHAGTAWYGTKLLAPRDLGSLLRYFGGTAAYLPPLLILVVLLLQQVARRDPWKLQPLVVSGMLAESVLGTVPLVVISHLTGRLLTQAALAAGPARGPEAAFQEVLVAIGAGVYEEFLFRLVLVSLILLIFVDIFGLRRDVLTVIAVVVGAMLFSLYHFTTEQLTGQAPLPWSDLVFRAVAGVYLGAVFVFRGLAVAVGTHGLYNVYVALLRM